MSVPLATADIDSVWFLLWPSWQPLQPEIKAASLSFRTRISQIADGARNLLSVLAEFLFPAEDPGYIPFLFSFFYAVLGLVEHGEAGVGQNVVLIDLDQSFGRSR